MDILVNPWISLENPCISMEFQWTSVEMYGYPWKYVLQETLGGANYHVLEDKLLKKEKLSKDEWHIVAHKAVHVHELHRLQAKMMSSGAERVQRTQSRWLHRD